MCKISFIIRISDYFDESFKVTSVPFFIPEFNLLRCELENFALKVLYQVIL